jgi:hypothetical protein
MDIESKIVELLQPIPTPQLRTYTCKKTTIPSFTSFSTDTTYDVDKMNTLIAEEINRIPPKNRWRSLGKSYQWELICKYLEDQEQYDNETLPSVKEKLKRALQNDNEIKVLFDHLNNKIQKICD